MPLLGGNENKTQGTTTTTPHPQVTRCLRQDKNKIRKPPELEFE